MKLALRGLRLPLPRFTLEVDVELQGRVAGLFGASGAGKTSLLELIVGLRRPTEGSMYLGGRMLADVGQWALAASSCGRETGTFSISGPEPII